MEQENQIAETLEFSERERAFFSRQVQQCNLVNGALQSNVVLIIEQHGLAGQWRLKQDASGLEKVGG